MPLCNLPTLFQLTWAIPVHCLQFLNQLKNKMDVVLILGPQVMGHCLKRLRRHDLFGGGMSLEVGFENLKTLTHHFEFT